MSLKYEPSSEPLHTLHHTPDAAPYTLPHRRFDGWAHGGVGGGHAGCLLPTRSEPAVLEVHPAPYTLHTTHYTLHPSHYTHPTLHPTPDNTIPHTAPILHPFETAGCQVIFGPFQRNFPPSVGAPFCLCALLPTVGAMDYLHQSYSRNPFDARCVAW